MRPQIVKILLLVLIFVNNATVLAQKAGPPPPTNNRGPELPIDSGILILIFLGLIYGAYIAYKRYRLNNNPA